MKTSFILALVLLVCGTFAANTDYVKLSSDTINKSQLIKDLRQLGAEYTLEKGIFPEEDALPNGYWIVYKTESVYKRVFNGATYYKYTVQLRCETDPILIRANFIVAIWNSNANTLVTSYSYSVIDENPNIPVATDAPEYIDNRLLKQGSDLWNLLDDGIKYTVKNAISKGLIKDSTYKFVRVYSIQDSGFSNPSGYTYLIQLISKEGYNYRARITIWENNSTPKYVIYKNV